jgi:hypothetical protein
LQVLEVGQPARHKEAALLGPCLQLQGAVDAGDRQYTGSICSVGSDGCTRRRSTKVPESAVEERTFYKGGIPHENCEMSGYDPIVEAGSE